MLALFFARFAARRLLGVSKLSSCRGGFPTRPAATDADTRLRAYIANNPPRWADDVENIARAVWAGLKPAPTKPADLCAASRKGDAVDFRSGLRAD
jgi:hypothetical protein